MVVSAHSLMAPGGANGRSMVISSLSQHFNEFSCMSVFFLGSVHDMTQPSYMLSRRWKRWKGHLWNSEW